MSTTKKITVYRPTHPNCDENGFVSQDVLVAERMIGRPLNDDEVVYHINQDDRDSRQDNLVVVVGAPSALHLTQWAENGKKGVLKTCPVCGKKFNRRANTCSYACAHISRQKKNRPTEEQLAHLLWQMPVTHIAEHYQVTDRAVHNWVTGYGITSKPPLGYWHRREIRHTTYPTVKECLKDLESKTTQS